MENYTFSEEVLLNYLTNLKSLIIIEEEKVLKKMKYNNISQNEINKDIDYIKYLRKLYRKTKKQII
jgi:hypothetical protein